MKNTLDAHVEFSFKGETYSLSATIDLDELLATDPTLSSLHAILARKNDIDTYSYLYEIMEGEEIRFDNAEGLAAECLTEGAFDLDAFAARRKEAKTLEVLQTIAASELGIDDLAPHPELKNALLHAYNLGRTHHAN